MATLGIFRVLEGGAQSGGYFDAAARAEYSPALSAVSIEALPRRVKLFAGCHRRIAMSTQADAKRVRDDVSARSKGGSS
jgi:hypothetical protein